MTTCLGTPISIFGRNRVEADRLLRVQKGVGRKPRLEDQQKGNEIESKARMYETRACDETSTLTGNTSGMPPLTALEPSNFALELRNRFSLPWADFHEMTVAP